MCNTKSYNNNITQSPLRRRVPFGYFFDGNLEESSAQWSWTMKSALCTSEDNDYTRLLVVRPLLLLSVLPGSHPDTVG